MKRLLKQTLGIMICLTLILGTVSTVFAVGDFEECCYCGETVLVDDLCDCGGCGDTTTACWAENHCEECGLCLEGEEYCLDCAPEIELPIEIDGSSLAGITEPTGITSLPTGDTFEYCDGACSDERFAANAWFDADDFPVDEFVAGYDYYYQISIHPTEGYHFPEDISELEDIEVTGVEWETVNYYYDSAKDLYYANFWIHYDGNGIPALKEVEFPIVIDGSELAGITEPTGISSLPTGDTFEYCDGACSDERFAANAWFDLNDNPVTAFEEGNYYYYQISVHPTEGYHFPKDVKNLEGIKVEGIVWDDVDYHYYPEKDLYYATFWIFYDELVGIPGVEADTDTETDTEVDTETESDTDTDTEEEPYVKGDVNKDGVLDIIDVVMARAHVVKTRTLTDEQIVIGDMNDDGMIDIIDVVMMRSKIVNG